MAQPTTYPVAEASGKLCYAPRKEYVALHTKLVWFAGAFQRIMPYSAPARHNIRCICCLGLGRRFVCAQRCHLNNPLLPFLPLCPCPAVSWYFLLLVRLEVDWGDSGIKFQVVVERRVCCDCCDSSPELGAASLIPFCITHRKPRLLPECIEISDKCLF